MFNWLVCVHYVVPIDTMARRKSMRQGFEIILNEPEHSRISTWCATLVSENLFLTCFHISSNAMLLLHIKWIKNCKQRKA